MQASHDRMATAQGALAGQTVWLLLIVALAAALRLHDLTRTSLWLDEGFSTAISSVMGTSFLRGILSDVHPPLYYILLHLWMALFGDGEWALRALSVAFGVLTVPVLFRTGQLIGGDRLGLVAAALLAASPLHIQYSTEIRMYALLVLCASGSIWGATRIALAPGDRRAVLAGSVAYGVSAGCAMFTHAAGVFLLPACSTLILAGWLFGGRPMSAVRPVVITHLVIGALLAALLPLLFTLRRNFVSTGWLAPPSLRSASEVFVALLGQRLADIHPLAAIAGAAVVGVAALAGAWAWRRDPVRIAFIGAVLVLPFALTIAVSHVFQPVFILRVHVWAVLPLSIIAAAGILAAPRLWPRAALASLVGLALSAGVVSYHALWSRPDWRGAARGIAASLAPEDIIVVPRVVGVDAVMGFYAPGIGERLTQIGDLDALDRAAAKARGRRVWVVTTFWHDRLPPAVVAERLSATHSASETLALWRLRVQRWDPAPR